MLLCNLLYAVPLKSLWAPKSANGVTVKQANITSIHQSLLEATSTTGGDGTDTEEVALAVATAPLATSSMPLTCR
jgi:hypothetical protein